MKKLMAMLIVAVLSAAAVFAGGSEEENTAPLPEFKDTITIATGADQNYMDGQMNNTNDVYLRAVYSQLVRRALDGSIEGDLAESWSVGEDGVTWTFNLRHGVKFHNGKELTSADVVASYRRLLDNTAIRYSSLVSGYIKDVYAVDDYTVCLVTTEQIASLLANLTHRSNLILDADYIEKYGMELGLTAESVNGTGPYRLAYWDRDQEMVLESFEGYYRGEVPTKKIDILIVSDANARLVAIETGQVDITTVNTSEVPRLQETPGIQVKMYEGIGAHGLQFNCANEYTKDTRVRQAISYAIDRQLIVDTLYASIGEKACTSPVNPNVWGYNDFGVIQQDLDKSRELLAEAGYPGGGFEISIMCDPTYNKATETCEMVVAMLSEVGINATIETVDVATFNSSMGGRTYPGERFPWAMFIMGFGAGTADCDEGLRRIWTTSPDGNNNNNYGWYSNAEVDRLLNEAKSELDEEKRLDLYRQAEQILFIDDPAAIFTNDRYSIWTMSDKVEGFEVNVNNAIFWDNLRCRN